MNNLLINEKPLYVQAQLGVLIGLNEAIVLQQIQFCTTLPNVKACKDGYKWVAKTYEDLGRYFPFWSIKTISRTIQSLEEKGILISCQPEMHNRKAIKHYRVCHAALRAVESEL